ncbi:putative beta-glucosidase [Aspergillus homomorphus CBS 101889]|uniref:beta-glucosidase n=1 Tax=Aspergillus homomorphus (strain CBS 101889) TaxID=1450537 RepID=A0A395HKI5_ASPHC|nr:hypothetical protein BO97DRAFT_428564 [Aspergillus homomorphus CBS 101889]RAL08260.1 hypothetical protein BO97DRAFT_428564 [Aspergillus homomorphus CBS 101889]
MSDRFATHSGVRSVNAGLDINMPGPIVADDPTSSYFGADLTSAVQNGSVLEARLDDIVRRVLIPYYLLHQDEPAYPTPDPSDMYVLAKSYGVDLGLSEHPPGRDLRADHLQLIPTIGAVGTVLLKNINKTLPLNKMKVNIDTTPARITSAKGPM